MVKRRVLVVLSGEVGRPLFKLLHESGGLRFMLPTLMKRRCERLDKMVYQVK